MKFAALILQLDGKRGGMHSIPGDTLGPLVDLAKKIRAAGEADIGGKLPVKVAGGAVLADWNMGPVLKFKCAKALK